MNTALSTVLLVDDDQELNRLVAKYLERNGLEVLVETDGERAVERIRRQPPAIVILDIMLPGQDGLSVCRTVRPFFTGPILMLTALGDDVDEVAGLETGADDYLAKPVRPRVLLARIRALLRRYCADADQRSEEPAERDPGQALPMAERPTINAGRLTVQASSREAFLDGQALHLTSAEFDLLYLLARRAGSVLSRDAIFRHLRGLSHDGLDRTIDLRISRLRRKLGDDPKNPRLIKSVRGVGYILTA